MDVALKQRLVGATVLIALAVIVLPMLLGGRPEEAGQESQKIELPPQPSELDFETRRFPIGETGAARPEVATERSDPAGAAADSGPGPVAHVELEPRDFQDARPESAPAIDDPPEAAVGNGEDTEAVTEGVQQPPAEPVAEVVESQPPPAVAPVEPAQPAAAASGGRYVVQVASFGSLDNANRLASSLQGQGYGVLSDTVESDVGTLHRVRIGPFGTEAEAGRAAARVRQSVEGVKPRIVDLQPDLAAQVTAPSDPLVRWVVQVGSFSSTGNADKLVERLRAEGLSAYKEAVSASGSTIYRVRVGPYIERDEAIRVDGLVSQRFGLDGVVMSAD
jgi:cell division septation protein DedD